MGRSWLRDWDVQSLLCLWGSSCAASLRFRLKRKRVGDAEA